MDFTYTSFPNKVHFGADSLKKLPELLEQYPRIMLFAEPFLQKHAAQLMDHFGEKRIRLYSNIVQHVPRQVVDEALEEVKTFAPDVLVSMGGGSAVGLAKAIALETELPITAVPSTYAGSEQTNIWGITTEEGKTTGRTNVVLPKEVVYDPSLTRSMPKALAVKSAMNAAAHLMEALYAIDGNPITNSVAILGLQHLRSGLQQVATTDELTAEANEHLLLGAYLAGKCLCEVSMALHHKAAHVLGGTFGMDHASVHTVLQAYVLEYQWPHLSSAVQEHFKSALESDQPAVALRALAADAGVATDLKSIGFKEEDIPRAASIMVSKPYPNPAPFDEEAILQMLQNAYKGVLN